MLYKKPPLFIVAELLINSFDSAILMKLFLLA